MKWLLLLMNIMMACHGFDHEKYRDIDHDVPIIVFADNYFVDASASIKLKIYATSTLATSSIKKNLVLIKDPESEKLSISSRKSRIPFDLKEDPDKKMWMLTSKEQLLASSNYGLFLKTAMSEKLLYVFRVKNLAPAIQTHDLGPMPLIVSNKRVNFRFVFDQPIAIHDDESIKLISLDAQAAPEINSITVEEDRRTIMVRLAKPDPSLLSSGSRFAFIFGDGIKNGDGQRAKKQSVEFSVQDISSDFTAIKPVMVRVSDVSAEIGWMLNNQHRSEFSVGLTDGDHRRVHEFCPLVVQALPMKFANSVSYLSRINVSGLKPRTPYRYVVRAEDDEGRILVVRGEFATTKPTSLRISEIMVNPKSRDEEGEFIEVVNTGDEPIDISALRVRIEDLETGKVTDCPLVGETSKMVIPRGAYFLIVSSAFSRQVHHLDESVMLVRTAQKTLCGGLPNSKPKIIQIHRGEGNFIDGFRGHLWQTDEGRSIERNDLKGLDELHNYCYSKIGLGPTPGRPNSSCGAGLAS